MSPDSGDHPAANGPAGVSVVIPVRDGERWLSVVLDSILAQGDGRPFEIIAVEDGSRDGSANVLRRYEAAATVRVVAGERRGAAAAINAGVRAAAHPVICQVDQDVILDPGWLARLVEKAEGNAHSGSVEFVLINSSAIVLGWQTFLIERMFYLQITLVGICNFCRPHRRIVQQRVGTVVFNRNKLIFSIPCEFKIINGFGFVGGDFARATFNIPR